MQNNTSFWSISPDVLSLVLIDYRWDKDGYIAEVSLKVEMEFTGLGGNDTDYMAFCQSPEGMIYIGTDWGNVITFDPVTFRVVSKGDLPKVSKMHVHRLLYSEGYVWIATWANGAIRYNPESGTYTQYTYNPKDKLRTLSHWDVYQICLLYTSTSPRDA